MGRPYAISKPLTSFSKANFQDMKNFIGLGIAPAVSVSSNVGEYWSIDKTSLLNIATEAAPEAVASAIKVGANKKTFTAKCNKMSAMIANVDLQTPDGGLEVKQVHVAAINEVLRKAHEFAVSELCVGTSSPFSGVTLAGNDQWDKPTTSDPIGDIAAAQAAVMKGCQHEANVIGCSYGVYQTLMAHPAIQKLVGFQAPVGVTAGIRAGAQVLAQIFGVDKFLVGSAQYMGGGLELSGTVDFVWGKHLWMGYVPSMVTKNSTSALLTMVYDELGNSSNTAPAMKDLFLDPPGAAYLEGRWWYTVETVDTGAGYYIKNAIA